MHPEWPGEWDRYDRVVRVMREVDADVWALQELAGESALRTVADAIGMECGVGADDGIARRVACDPGGRGFGVGLMWRHGIAAVPGTLCTYTDDLYFHGLVKVVLDVGGLRLQAASTHLTPFGGPQIATEARRVVSNLVRPDGRPPGIVGSDSNGITGDRVRRLDGSWDWHAADPYVDQAWHDALVWQCRWSFDAKTGRRVHWADREAGEVLWTGGLYEAGAVLDAPVAPTVGHWPSDDPYGPRDIDHLRVTRELVPAVRAVGVYRTELALAASDHLPKVVELDLSRVDTNAVSTAGH
ncbi:endonuclease/exonuclease/phosphatase family protein [Amycolatopsis aidingensis]|uniref:endonuclease/exonuclease/phosphatase family protein n=1 Tax=Amycolatopsis aidingensis TaxID=2842453 RepID=UPI002FC67CC4